MLAEGGIGNRKLPIIPALLRYFSVKQLVDKFGMELYLARIHYPKLIAHFHFGRQWRRQIQRALQKKLTSKAADLPRP